MERARPADLQVFGELPRPGTLDLKRLRRPQGPRSGINALWGKLPGDEIDEVLTNALDEMS